MTLDGDSFPCRMLNATILTLSVFVSVCLCLCLSVCLCLFLSVCLSHLSLSLSLCLSPLSLPSLSLSLSLFLSPGLDRPHLFNNINNNKENEKGHGLKLRTVHLSQRGPKLSARAPVKPHFQFIIHCLRTPRAPNLEWKQTVYVLSRARA